MFPSDELECKWCHEPCGHKHVSDNSIYDHFETERLKAENHRLRSKLGTLLNLFYKNDASVPEEVDFLKTVHSLFAHKIKGHCGDELYPDRLDPDCRECQHNRKIMIDSAAKEVAELESKLEAAKTKLAAVK